MTDITERQAKSLRDALVASFDEFTDPATEIETLRAHADALAALAEELIEDVPCDKENCATCGPHRAIIAAYRAFAGREG